MIESDRIRMNRKKIDKILLIRNLNNMSRLLETPIVKKLD